jgi:hypothetical protein
MPPTPGSRQCGGSWVPTHQASYPFLRGAGLCVAGFLCARSEAATLLTAFEVFGLESNFPAFEASFPLVGMGGTSAGIWVTYVRSPSA